MAEGSRSLDWIFKKGVNNVKRNRIALFLGLVMVLGTLPLHVFATFPGFENFVRSKEFRREIFRDVKPKDWFYENVKSVYEYGLMEGKGESIFDPQKNITLGETITVAARLHSIYHFGQGDFPRGQSPWYTPYLEYARKNGIPTDFSNFSKSAERWEFAVVLASAFPDEGFLSKNTVKDGAIPDVKNGDSYGTAVYKLYRAGILIGNDGVGTFAPKTFIKRGEVAAILSRMAEPKLRKEITLTGGGAPGSGNTSPSGGDFEDMKSTSPWGSGENPGGSGGGSSGGNGFPEDWESYVEVTFYAGEEIYKKDFVRKGKILSLPPLPKKNGNILDGWYEDPQCKIPFKDGEPLWTDKELYGLWERRTGDITQVCLDREFSYEKDPDEETVTLTVDKGLVLLGTEDIVTVNATTNLDLGEVELYWKDTGDFLGMLYDDGKEEHGDLIAKDGIFSGLLSPPVLTDATVFLEAKGGSKISNQCVVEYRTPFSTSEKEELNKVEERLKDTMKKVKDGTDFQGFEMMEALEETLADLTREGLIKAGFQYDRIHSIIGFQYKNGLRGIVDPFGYPPEVNGGRGAEREKMNFPSMVLKAPPEEFDDTSVSNTLILNSFPAFETEPEDIAYRSVFYGHLAKSWNQEKMYVVLDSSDIKVEDYKAFDGYTLVCISTHGGCYQGTPYICLRELITEETDKRYAAEQKAGGLWRTVTDDGTYYCITPTLIDLYYPQGTLSNTFFFLECCNSLGEGMGDRMEEYNFQMADAFRRGGAKGYVGFHNSVGSGYCREFMKSFGNHLARGCTGEDAYQAACREIGANSEDNWNKEHHDMSYGDYIGDKIQEEVRKYEEDPKTNPEPAFQEYTPDFHIAYPIYYGDPKSSLVCKGIVNGSFLRYNKRTLAPSAWIYNGNSYTLGRLGHLKFDKNRMAVITTGLGARKTEYLGGGIEGTRLTQRIQVPEDAKYLRFDWNFISEEPMEFYGTNFNDQFIFRGSVDGAVICYQVLMDINSTKWRPLSDINLQGGDDTVYQSGWKEGTLDVEKYRGKSMTLNFIIADFGDSIYDSIVLLDQVRFQRADNTWIPGIE